MSTGFALHIGFDTTESMKSFFLHALIAVSFIVCIGAGAAEPAPTKLRVLFIGNSLTSTNDLPGMLAVMAESSGRELTAGRQIVGGATL